MININKLPQNRNSLYNVYYFTHKLKTTDLRHRIKDKIHPVTCH